jgi:hypothetical protein
MPAQWVRALPIFLADDPTSANNGALVAADGDSAVPTWILGMLICLFGSTLSALGLVLQKYSHSKGSAAAVASAYFLRKWWVIGFLIFLSAQLINMVSMAMTPQAVLSCLGAWTLVCNTLFARLLLGETVCRGQALAGLGLVGAMALVVYNAPRVPVSQEGYHGDVLLLAARFASPEFEWLTLLLVGAAFLARFLAMGLPPPSAAGGCAGGAFLRLDCFRRILEPVSWAAAAAVAAGYTALLFKCLAELLASHARGPTAPPMWSCWETYAMACMALWCAPTELHFLNLALQTGEAVLVVPTYLALGMLSQLLTGAVIFKEFQYFSSASHAFGFGFGTLLTLAFVALTARAQEKRLCPGSVAPREVGGGVERGGCYHINAPELHVKLVPELRDVA